MLQLSLQRLLVVKKFRTELANAMRNKLGNLFKSIMDRGANFNNTEKVGNKEKKRQLRFVCR